MTSLPVVQMWTPAAVRSWVSICGFHPTSPTNTELNPFVRSKAVETALSDHHCPSRVTLGSVTISLGDNTTVGVPQAHPQFIFPISESPVLPLYPPSTGS